MLGYESEADLLELGPGPLYADRAARERLVERARSTGAVATCELDWLRADGVPITVRLGGNLIPGPSGEPVFEMIVQDVTEEKRTEDQLRQTQKMEAIGKLAGGIAHDFNNILTVIGGNVELLEGELQSSDPMRDDLHQISKATMRGASLTRRLLSFSRSQRTGRQIVDVNEIIPDLSKMLVPILGETIALEVDTSGESLPVDIDPGELEQVILNLVLNARDAMPRGGRVRIATALGNGRDDVPGGDEPARVAMLSVQDTGVGIAPGTGSRIFEPFYTTKPMGQGTGLGLSTVYGIVSRAGGSVGVESEPGQGATLTVRLPIAAAGEQPSAPAADVPTRVPTERILVVEDDEMVRRFVERALREVGYRVRSVASASEALDVSVSEGSAIDLVLTDIVMPGGSGQELAERLAVRSPSTPVLYMSGYVDPDTVGEEFEPADDTILRKPFSASDLRSAVRRALDRSGARIVED
jgi:signal transduction histidine kinase/ActR/RegA family two-component response regulator